VARYPPPPPPVGPASFWTNGAGDAVESVHGGQTVAQDGSLGVFTTGLTAIWDLKWLPANYGGWYIKGGPVV
jgi:hypothetical protein